MSKTLKLNFTVPQDVADELKNRVSKSHRSAFVTEAIQKRLEELRKKDLEKELEEGYKARRGESAEITREWEKISHEHRE